MTDRRRPLHQPARQADLSPTAIHVLRAIRSDLDGTTYRGTDARAAALAEVSEAEARRALHGLSERGFLRLDRSPAPKRA